MNASAALSINGRFFKFVSIVKFLFPITFFTARKANFSAIWSINNFENADTDTITRKASSSQAPAQDDDRGTGAKATGRALEICDHRCRHRRRYDEDRLTNTPNRIPSSSRT